MTARMWVILGATSLIAEQFAHLAAARGHSLCLVGRDEDQLKIIAQDIRLRYKVPCLILHVDFSEPNSIELLLNFLKQQKQEMDLLLAQSDFSLNNQLNDQTITKLLNINVYTSLQTIHAYFNLKQNHYCVCFLSSVAACRGRAQNSFYGSSKAAVELYLEGLQQKTSKNQNIIIARFGFIDTKQTYGKSGIFYAAPAKKAAEACWKAILRKKRRFYYPGFWSLIMAVITRLPFFIYKKMNF